MYVNIFLFREKVSQADKYSKQADGQADILDGWKWKLVQEQKAVIAG